MPTIDLGAPQQSPAGLLEALPRRVSLTLPELRLVAAHAGDAPLPFVSVAPPDANPLDGRLGESPAALEHAAYTDALGTLHDPDLTLARRGLLDSDGPSPELVGAIGLLATPATALDIDVTAAGIRARAWHRRSGSAVATLSTVDGIVFELAWFGASQWAAELGRVAVLPEDLRVRASDVPAQVELPYELADGAAEAVRSGRADLVPVLTAQHPGSVTGPDGPLGDLEAGALLGALIHETQGRLRVLVADVSGDGTTVVGVVSWTLLADGWHAVRPRHADGAHQVVLSAVEPCDLATELAPVLAEVSA